MRNIIPNGGSEDKMVMLKINTGRLLEMIDSFPGKYPAGTTVDTHIQEPIKDRVRKCRYGTLVAPAINGELPRNAGKKCAQIIADG